MTWKKKPKPNRLKKKKERMKMRKHSFNKCRKRKKLRILRLILKEFEVSGKLRPMHTSILLMQKLN